MALNDFVFRYARWSLGFVNPPLEVSGTGQKCTIRALNDRGHVLLPAVIESMNRLLEENILEGLEITEGQVDVTVVPPSEVGTFSEEDRSRQVCVLLLFISVREGGNEKFLICLFGSFYFLHV